MVAELGGDFGIFGDFSCGIFCLFAELGGDFWVGIFIWAPSWVGILGNPHPAGWGFYAKLTQLTTVVTKDADLSLNSQRYCR